MNPPLKMDEPKAQSQQPKSKDVTVYTHNEWVKRFNTANEIFIRALTTDDSSPCSSQLPLRDDPVSKEDVEAMGLDWETHQLFAKIGKKATFQHYEDLYKY